MHLCHEQDETFIGSPSLTHLNENYSITDVFFLFVVSCKLFFSFTTGILKSLITHCPYFSNFTRDNLLPIIPKKHTPLLLCVTNDAIITDSNHGWLWFSIFGDLRDTRDRFDPLSRHSCSNEMTCGRCHLTQHITGLVNMRGSIAKPIIAMIN